MGELRARIGVMMHVSDSASVGGGVETCQKKLRRRGCERTSRESDKYSAVREFRDSVDRKSRQALLIEKGFDYTRNVARKNSS